MKRIFLALFFLVSLALPIFSAVRSEASPVISINVGRPYRTVYYPEPVYVRARPVYVAKNHCDRWDCDNWRKHRWYDRDYDRDHGHNHGHRDHGRHHEDRDR